MTMRKMTRRGLIAAGAGVVAAQAVPAKAAAGDPVILGQENRSPVVTTLQGTESETVLLVNGNTDGAVALFSNDNQTGTAATVIIHSLRGTALSVTDVRGEGAALQVNGRTEFSRSGRVVIPAGWDSARVQGVDLSRYSSVLATLQANVDGLMLKAAVPHPKRASITLHLSAVAVTDVPVAWFVLD